MTDLSFNARLRAAMLSDAEAAENKRLRAAKANTTDITLRDYFAARAMAAYLIADQGNTPEPEQTANAAYFMANAMLKAREK